MLQSKKKKRKLAKKKLKSEKKRLFCEILKNLILFFLLKNFPPSFFCTAPHPIFFSFFILFKCSPHVH